MLCCVVLGCVFVQCHEVRNCIHATLSNSEFLLEAPLAARLRENVTTIHEVSEQLMAVVSDALDINRFEGGCCPLNSSVCVLFGF